MDGTLLSYQVWLSLPAEKRKQLVALFNIPRSGESVVKVGSMSSAGNIAGEHTQDGHTPKDLVVVTVAAMQQILKSKETDFYKLFNRVVENSSALSEGETIQDFNDENIVDSLPIDKEVKVEVKEKIKKNGTKNKKTQTE